MENWFMSPTGIRYLNILLVSTLLSEPWYASAFVSNSNSRYSGYSGNNNVLMKPFTSSLAVKLFSSQSYNRKIFVLRDSNCDDDDDDDDNNNDDNGNDNNNNNNNTNHTDEFDKIEISQTTTIAAAVTTTTINEDKTNEIIRDDKDWNTSLFPAKNFLPPPPLLEETESGDKNVKSKRLRSRNSIKQLSSKEKKKRIDVDAYDENRFRTQLKIQGLAVMVGLLSGVAVSFFKMGIESVRELCYTGGFGLDLPLISYIPVFAITTLGGIAVAIFAALGAFPPGVRGEIDEVDDASLSFFDDVHYDDGTNYNNDTLEKKIKRFDLLYAFAFVRKAFASIFTLGTGCSLGPEGPSVEVAMAMSRVCMFLWPPETTNVNGVIIDENGDIVDDEDGIDGSYKYSKENVEARVRRNRLLLSCGAAAGVSAGFNAPLAGVFFALEVVQAALPSLTVPTVPATPALASSTKLIELRQESLSAEPSSITAILIASVVSGLVARILLGNYLALAVTTYEIKTPLLELPLYLMLGALSGLVAVAFSQSAKLTKRVFDGECGPAPVKTAFGSLPRFARPVIGALTCGIVGSFYPQVLFFGYDTLNGLLGNNSIPTITLLTLLAAKIFTTAVAAGSGLVGGTFAPSLFLGGMCGASFHNIVQFLFTSFDVTAVGGFWALSDVPAYAMVGAASTLAALFRAPLTASLLLFELTRNYDILIPLLASAGVGSLVSDIVESNIEARNYKK
jgi:H+/Cl- antiporter ClcA